MSSTRYDLNEFSFPEKRAKLLYISTSKYEEDWNSIAHAHHFSELFFILSGQGSFLIGGEEVPVKPYDLVIINPNIEHTEKSYAETPMEYIVFGIEGLSFSFRKAPDALTDSSPYFIHNYDDSHNNLSIYLTIMLQEITQKTPGYGIICQNLLDIVLTTAARYQDIAMTADTSLRLNKECALIKQYLDSHYADNITLDFLAKMTHLNKYYIVHVFTKHTGMSPINYLLDRRIKEAKSLLESTNYSIAQIASALGFSSQSYFAQAFKRLTQMTPNQYRKECKIEVIQSKTQHSSS